MRTTRTKVLLVLALLFAGLAAWLANAWVQQQVKEGSKTAGGTVPIVVAALDISYGQQLEPIHLKLVPWPESALPDGWIGNVVELEGKIAKRDITAGDVVTKDRIVEHLGGSKLSALIDKSKRAMSVRVDDVVGVAGFLLPGNHVDIYGVRKLYGNTNEVKVRLVLEDVVVLAVDQEASPKEDAPKVVRAVTVEVSPEQAEDLVKAMHEGNIQLTLRNPLDRERVSEVAPPPPLAPPPPAPAPPKAVVKKKSVKAEPPPPPAPVQAPKPAPVHVETVTVIRGLDVTEVQPQFKKEEE